jgi:hypothetical protein
MKVLDIFLSKDTLNQEKLNELLPKENLNKVNPLKVLLSERFEKRQDYLSITLLLNKKYESLN